MTTVRLTMAQALVRWLMAQRTELDGVEAPLFPGVFAIFGHGNVTCLSEALEAVKGELPTWRGQNEQSMALAAIGFAKAKARRQIMVAASSIGPGATNMVTAAGVAHTNRLPVLLLSGDYYVSRLPDPVLQQVEHWGDPTISVNDAFKPVTRYWDRITRPEQLLQSLPQALGVLLDPADCGPAFLGLCQDVQAEAFDYPERFFAPTVHHIPRPRPDLRQLEQAAALLRTARKPLLIAGGGVRYSGSEAVLADVRHPPSRARGRDHRRADGAGPRPPDERGPDRRPGLELGQPPRGRGRRRARRRNPAAGLHHRVLVAVRRRRPVHRPQRRTLRRAQASGAARGRRRTGRSRGARRRAARLAGARGLADPGAARSTPSGTPSSTSAAARPTPSCRPTPMSSAPSTAWPARATWRSPPPAACRASCA